MGPAGGAALTLLLKVQQPVQQDQGLHQRGQQQRQAEEGHHAVLLGLVGPQGSGVQGRLGVQPDELQPPLHVSVGSAGAALRLVRGAAAAHAHPSLRPAPQPPRAPASVCILDIFLPVSCLSNSKTIRKIILSSICPRI